MNKSIGILGCGWLGLPLAKKFKDLGYQVCGTTTSEKKLKILKNVGVTGFKIFLSEDKIQGDINGFLSKIDALIINVPPGLRNNPNTDYAKKMALLNEALNTSTVQNVLFVSSTSVYGSQTGEITEETTPKPVSESGKQLLHSEKLFFNQENFMTTVVRFGGLIGTERHPVNHLTGKKELKNGDETVNLIHLDDCIHIITTVIENGYWGEIFNGVYPYHPTKEEYYIAEAKKRKLTIPKYDNTLTKNRKKTIFSRNFLHKGHVLHTSIVS